METGSILIYLSIFISTAIIMMFSNRNDEKILFIAVGDRRLGKLSSKTGIIIVATLIPAFFAGIRYGIGSDYSLYLLDFNHYVNQESFQFITTKGINIEVGFYLLVKLSYCVFHTYQGFLFVCAFITYLLVFLALRRYSNYASIGLSTLIFLILYTGPSYNILRQTLAAAIGFYAYKYIEERKPIKYLIAILIAMSFHLSTIVLIPLYFLGYNYDKENIRYKLREKIIVISLLAIPILYNLVFGILSRFGVFSRYISLYSVNQWNMSYRGIILLHLPIGVLILLNWKKLKELRKENQLFLYMYVLEYSSILLGTYMHWAIRLINYFLFSEVVLVPQIIHRQEKSLSKVLVTAFVIIYYIAYFVFLYAYCGDDKIFPYKNIFMR